MKRNLAMLAIGLIWCSVLAWGADRKAKPGPLTGTWECMAYGSSQGDLPFTLYLEQQKDVVSGSVSSPLGSTEITSGSYRKKRLDLRIDTPQGNYVLTAKLKKGQLTGTWTLDSPPEQGTWEGKKQVPTSK